MTPRHPHDDEPPRHPTNLPFVEKTASLFFNGEGARNAQYLYTSGICDIEHTTLPVASSAP